MSLRELIEPDDLVFKVAGYPEPILIMRGGIQQCGEIKDGVAFAHGNKGGGWVVSFDDLERMYLRAKGERKP